MKKTIRNLLILLAVLAVLGGAVAALVLLPNQTGSEEENSSSVAEDSSAAEELTLTDRVSADVASLTVENKEGTFRLIPGAGSTETSPEFVPEGYEEYPINTSVGKSNVAVLTTLTATRDLGEQEDLESFGLAGEDAAVVTLEYKDGETVQMVLGNEAAATSGRYVLKDGRVYIAANIGDELFGSVFGYFNTGLYTVAKLTETVTDSDGNVSDKETDNRMISLSLSGSNFPEAVNVVFRKTDVNEYVMTEPMMAESNTDAFQDLISSLATMTATGVADAGLDEEKLEKYGLAEPFAKAEFNMNNEEHTVTVSSLNGDGERYLLLDDRDIVYRIGRETVAPWAECRVIDLRQSYIWLPAISQVQKLTFTVDGTEYGFTTTRTKNEEESTEKRITYDQTVQNAEGKDLDFEKYQNVYVELISLPAFTVDRVEWSGAPALKVKYDYFDGNGDELAFYLTEQGRYVVTLNGKFNGQARKTEVDQIISQIPGLYEGE